MDSQLTMWLSALLPGKVFVGDLNRSGRRLLIFTAAAGSAAGIGYLRYLTGPEYAFSLFYLFPVVAVTWYLGIKAGLGMAAISALTWLGADLTLPGAFSHPYVPYINEIFRFAVFCIVVVMVHKLHFLVGLHKEFARFDPLTGIPNRLAFFELAEIELNKAKRFRHPLSIVYVDLDNFKYVNDIHGHETGDRLLRLVARTIHGNIRITDLAARLGGDEFAVLLPETGRQAAGLVALKLCREIEVMMQESQWPVTASIGVVTYEELSTGLYEMIASADAVMYSAKRNGKNRVVQQVVAAGDAHVAPDQRESCAKDASMKGRVGNACKILDEQKCD